MLSAESDLNIVLSSASKLPFFRQIANQIGDSLRQGGLRKGSSLPSLRKLSRQLAVSLTTVKNAYEALEAMGLIVVSAGHGHFVAGQPTTAVDQEPAASPGDSAVTLPDRYKTIRRLGTGGHAVVILAEDLQEPSSRKAIKVLHGAIPAEMLPCFKDEFRILASLTHPGLARVHEFGQLPDGRAYYTAELIEGLGLAQVSSDLRSVCLATAAVCRTLAYIHARGLVHNDVKPDNILVPRGAPGDARLLDFGLSGLARTSGHTVAGTPGYIAPERLAGRAWGGRADLFSLGATLYRVLGGRRIIEEEKPDKALAALRAGYRPLGELRPDLPPALSTLVTDLLALEATARPRATEVVARLGDVLGEVLPLETPGSAYCYTLSSLFVGRQAELDRAKKMLAAAADPAEPRFLAIAGEPGIGKSRFLRELTWHAQTGGWQVRAIGCNDCGEASELLAACAGRTLLVVDDAHSAGDGLWQTLLTLTRRAREQSCLLCVAATFDGALPELGAHVLAQGEALRLSLEPISPSDQRHLLDSLFGRGVLSDALQATIARRSGGNPLLMEEMVRELVETGVIHNTPAGWSTNTADWLESTPHASSAEGAPANQRLSDFFARRCRRLPQPAAEAMAVIAALGGRTRVGAVVEVAGEGIDARPGVELLAESGLASVEGGEVSFIHDALLEVALSRLAPERRRELHRRAAAVLARGAEEAQLARAFREAGDLQATFRHALAAARRAEASGVRQARFLVEQALSAGAELAVDGETMAELHQMAGTVYRRLGRPIDAQAAHARAFELAATAPERRVAAAAGAARAALTCDDQPAVDVWMERAREAATCIPQDRLAAATVAQAAGLVAFSRRQVRAARELQVEALRQLEPLDGPGALALRASALTDLATTDMYFDSAASLAGGRMACEVAAAAGDRHLMQVTESNLGAFELVAGSGAAAATRLRRIAVELERDGGVCVLPAPLAHLAETEDLLCRPTRARILLQKAAAMGLRESAGDAQVSAALIAWHQGDLDEAEQLAKAVLAAARPTANLAMALVIAAAVAAERGASAEAHDHAERAAREAALSQTPWHDAMAEAARAFTAAADGEAASAAKALAAALSHLLAMGRLEESGALMRETSRLFASAGNNEAAAEYLRQQREAGRRTGLNVAGARSDNGRGRAAEPDASQRHIVTSSATDHEETTSEAPVSRLEPTVGPLDIRHDFPGVIGRSEAMRRALTLLDRLVDSEATVLLTGETGTGKEVFARALHAAGPRHNGPFVPVDCTAIPGALFEAEVFGAVRGAFTGAVRDRVGLAETASGGTLFFDEIGELPLEVQPKLLRLLEERRVRPLGGSRDKGFDARVISATNRELSREVATGRFRSDLYFRLNVVEISVPPLRQRKGDIPELCRHLLDQLGRAGQIVSPRAERRLLSYPWPGNVRELENELQRASLLAGSGPIEPRHLSPKIRQNHPRDGLHGRPLASRVDALKREMIVDALRQADGNRTATARSLGLTRVGLRGIMLRLGLK